MKAYVKITILSLLLGAAQTSFATEALRTTQLSKSDIKTLKMFSAQEDRIVVFVTDQSGNKYRIGSMPKVAVERLLDSIKTNESLTLQARKVENKSYLEVVAWN